MTSNSSITISRPNITVEPRDVVLSVFLTFITLGIYGLYWQYKLTNEIHALSGKPQPASGGKAVFIQSFLLPFTVIIGFIRSVMKYLFCVKKRGFLPTLFQVKLMPRQSSLFLV